MELQLLPLALTVCKISSLHPGEGSAVFGCIAGTCGGRLQNWTWRMNKMRYILSAFLCVVLLSGCAMKADENPLETTATLEITQEPTTVPESETAVMGYPITLYVPNEDITGFLQINTEIPELEVSQIFSALAEAGALKEEAKANSLEIQGTKLLLDVNDAFAAQVGGYGTSGEYYMMGSVVNTLLTAYQADALFITANGEILETGHSIYDYGLTFYPEI